MKHGENGNLFWRLLSALLSAKEMNIPLHAAYAGYFIMLALFPTLMLILAALNYVGIGAENFMDLIRGFLPGALVGTVEQLVDSTSRDFSGALLGVSALTALWAASRGIYGLLTGLNAIYDVSEDRGYVYTRLLSVVYTFAFLLVLLLTLGLHVFGTSLLGLLERSGAPFFRFLLNLIDVRFFLLLFVQTGIFCAMFMVLPNRRNRFWDSLPGAVLASLGWLVFSDLYSIYVERFARLTNVYGSVYAVALSMLWLYCCMSIVFYGGALNRYLMEH